MSAQFIVNVRVADVCKEEAEVIEALDVVDRCIGSSMEKYGSG